MDYSLQIDELINGMSKPPGSLGLLEKHIKRLLLSWGEMRELKPYHLVFAADNGVVEEGVALFPPAITYLHGQAMAAGRAVINAFCRTNGIPCEVIDVGVNGPQPVGLDRKAANGSKNFVKEPAMSEEEYAYVRDAAAEYVEKLVKEQGRNLFSFGEMGIGNTTTSSAVLHALTGIDPDLVVGYGAGASQPSSEILKMKSAAIDKGMLLHKAKLHTPHDIMRCLGGFDIVAMCSAMLTCAKLHIPFVIDGFISAVATACAASIDPQVKKHAIPSHLSKEPGMIYALLLSGIMADDVPIRADMALGEGTGAVLMVGLLKAMLEAVKTTVRLSEFDLGDTAL